MPRLRRAQWLKRDLLLRLMLPLLIIVAATGAKRNVVVNFEIRTAHRSN